MVQGFIKLTFLWYVVECYSPAFDTDSGPRPPEFMSDHRNIISSGPVDL